MLLLRWTDDDLNIQVELDRLRDVFDCQFKFATEQFNIPSINSTRTLQSKLYEFQEAHQSQSELLIVYYGGHGEASRRGKSVWAAYVSVCFDSYEVLTLESAHVEKRRAVETLTQLGVDGPIEH